jgi:hypothetical protein
MLIIFYITTFYLFPIKKPAEEGTFFSTKIAFFSGTSTIQDCEAHIAQLELTLDAKVISPSSNSFTLNFIEPLENPFRNDK